MIFTILYIVLAVVIAGAGAHNVRTRLQLGTGPRTKGQLSEPSKKILRRYQQLPRKAREIDNLPKMLAAMDFKFDAENVTKHFQNVRSTYDGTKREFIWSCRCYRDCEYEEYKNIFDSIGRIHYALDKRKKAEALAAKSDVLENAGSLAERFNSEATAIEKSAEGL